MHCYTMKTLLMASSYDWRLPTYLTLVPLFILTPATLVFFLSGTHQAHFQLQAFPVIVSSVRIVPSLYIISADSSSFSMNTL